MLALEDTIAAIATPNGAGAARGIVRISGPQAVECLRDCFLPAREWKEHRLTRPCVIPGSLAGTLSIPCDAYVWPSRKSYTREPVAELHTLGSPPLLEAALQTICAAGARLARPGEFTLRAFLAGRLDLVQAEAVLGVIDAQDRRVLDLAIAQMAGGVSAPLKKLRGDLLDLLADLEAGLDFVDENIQFVTSQEVLRRLGEARAQLRSITTALSDRSTTSGAFRVVLTGWPNTGKSSLFNALVGNDRSLVSAAAGTTRDYLQADMDFARAKCLLIDTAGIETMGNDTTIAVAAQHLADAQIQQADLRLFCIDSTRPLNDAEQQRIALAGDDTLLVKTKCDGPAEVRIERTSIQTSAMTRHGLDVLGAEIAARLALLSARPIYAVASTAARCRESVVRAAERLAGAERCTNQASGDELVAAELRGALDELGKVTGAVYTEEVLDRIFSRFCIGK